MRTYPACLICPTDLASREGNDGPWSSFTVQVGTPAQDVRVLISTAGTETWVVVPEGCGSDAPSNCATLRGEEFNINASSTWTANNFYGLELESNLGYTGNGEFGFDTVGLSWQGSGGPSLEHQVVAGIAADDFWLGTFGLTPRPTNFSNFNDPQPSFMQKLKNESMIPSLSWAYHAGAPYRKCAPHEWNTYRLTLVRTRESPRKSGTGRI